MQARTIIAQYPPVGSFFGTEGERLHFADIQLAPGETGPTVLFLHGASGNLKDQMVPFAPVLQDKARLIFVDRPGHGYSDRAGAETPAQQATRYRHLLDKLEVEQATIVGHSLGAASAVAFAVLFPERTKGLVLLAPATHSWSTGVNWYYSLAAAPIAGHLFTETVLLPAGLQTLSSAIKSVFEPQLPPKDYVDSAAIPLAFIPKTFRSNARDVAGLNEFVKVFSSRYREISAPTVIVTGDSDDIVAPSIHSVGLERDIAGAELIVIKGLGHKPEYQATQVAVDAILKVSN